MDHTLVDDPVIRLARDTLAVESQLAARGLLEGSSVFREHRSDSAFVGRKLVTDGLVLIWGQCRSTNGSPKPAMLYIRLSLGDERLVVQFCKDLGSDEPRIQFGHRLTPNVSTFLELYGAPSPSLDLFVKNLADYISRLPGS